MRRTLASFCFLLTACSVGGGPPGPGTDAGTSADAGSLDDCPSEQLCREGTLCCPGGEVCVDGLYCQPPCDYERCGDNGSVCCGAEQLCVDGVVCAAICTSGETLCGAALDTCCGAGDLCLADACTTPGRACDEDFECWDPALYCERTVGRCLPVPDGEACEVRPPPAGAFGMEVERHFAGVTIEGVLYDKSDGVPLVGDVSGDGVPDIVTTMYADSFNGANALVAISGDDLRVHLALPPGANGAERYSIALANFDPSDPALEIAYCASASGDVRIIRGDGREIARRAHGCHGSWGSLEVADINADGTPDVISGCSAYDGRNVADPSMDLFDVPCRYTFGGPIQFHLVMSSIADLDGDGRPEVTLGGVAINDDGSVLWEVPDANGYTAVADLDRDGAPEVVVSRQGQVLARRGSDGQIVFGPYDVPPGGTPLPGAIAPPQGLGGAPNIADFDSDGYPEIGLAGATRYAVFDPDCAPSPRAGGFCGGTPGTALLWERVTQDNSSHMTGSSVFDFQDDGVAEVLYNDECFLYVLDGRTGADVIEPIPTTTHTFLEYPVVADADGDGQSELLVTSNPVGSCLPLYAAHYGVPESELPADIVAGTRGIFVYGDPMQRWVPTRSIWNQYSYHVTNIEEDGSVPRVEPDNWRYGALNNYRQNVQVGVYNAPNLVVELQAGARCANDTVNLSVVVRNVGSRGVPPGVVVNVRRIAPGAAEDVGVLTTSEPLLPGGSERLGLSVESVPFDVDLTFEATLELDPAMPAQCVDDDDTSSVVTRCDTLI